MLTRTDLPADVLALLAEGAVIPAHPLALNARREFDRRRQRALTRYYVDAGAKGLAVGVHTTQFNIREAGLYEEILSRAMEDQREWSRKPMIMIAGICGRTAQARREAQLAVSLGYHAGLVSWPGMPSATEEDLLAHCETIGREIPLVGFYLQRPVGGPIFPADSGGALRGSRTPGDQGRPLQSLPDARCHSRRGRGSRRERCLLYTGNDDHIVLDLALPFTVMRDDEPVTGALSRRIARSLVGMDSHGRRAPADDQGRGVGRRRPEPETSRAGLPGGPTATRRFSTPPIISTDASRAATRFCGGQGLLEGIWCLNPAEGLGPGQQAEIDRVCHQHADLADDPFVTANLPRWLA